MMVFLMVSRTVGQWVSTMADVLVGGKAAVLVAWTDSMTVGQKATWRGLMMGVVTVVRTAERMVAAVAAALVALMVVVTVPTMVGMVGQTAASMAWTMAVQMVVLLVDSKADGMVVWTAVMKVDGWVAPMVVEKVATTVDAMAAEKAATKDDWSVGSVDWSGRRLVYWVASLADYLVGLWVVGLVVRWDTN
jgi:hypothetical protein